MSKTNLRNNRHFHSSKIYKQERLNANRKLQLTEARKKSLIIEWNGEKHTLKEWSEILNIPVSTLKHRYHDCWPIEKIMTTKHNKTNKFIEFGGKKLKISQWSKLLNISIENIQNRLYHLGWSIEKTLTTSELTPSEKHMKRIYYYNGKYQSLYDLSKQYNISYKVLYNRVKRLKKTIQEALDMK